MPPFAQDHETAPTRLARPCCLRDHQAGEVCCFEMAVRASHQKCSSGGGKQCFSATCDTKGIPLKSVVNQSWGWQPGTEGYCPQPCLSDDRMPNALQHLAAIVVVKCPQILPVSVFSLQEAGWVLASTVC